MRTLLIVLLSFALLISLAALVFAVQNTAVVAVRFLLWQFESSLALVLLIAFALGALVMALVLSPPLIRARISRRSMQRRLSRQEGRPPEQPEGESETSHSGP